SNSVGAGPARADAVAPGVVMADRELMDIIDIPVQAQEKLLARQFAHGILIATGIIAHAVQLLAQLCQGSLAGRRPVTSASSIGLVVKRLRGIIVLQLHVEEVEQLVLDNR